MYFTFVLGYIFLSVLFFKYPNLIHKRKRIKFMCRHISHRGGAGESYENTMHAFKRAYLLGTDMLELDCHLTKDGHVVVSHDHNLLRSTGVDKDISFLDYKDLPLLNTILPIDFDPDYIYKGSGNEHERRFILLEEVFKEFPNFPINIDVKIDDDRLIKKISTLIQKYKREDYTVWGNDKDDVTSKLYMENPNVPLLFSKKRVLQLVFLIYTGLLPFVPIKETHLEIFLPTIYLRNKSCLFAGYLPLKLFTVHLMKLLLMKKCIFEHLHKRGIQTYLWVLNYEEEFKEAYELGVTGVMTDYPTKLKKFLDANPKYQ